MSRPVKRPRPPAKSRRGARPQPRRRSGRPSDRRQPARRPPATRYLAQCSGGLEEGLADELVGLGAEEIEIVPSGVFFAATREQALRSVLWLRSAVRVLEPIVSGPVSTNEDLYDLTATAPWEELVGTRRTFAVRAALSGTTFTDTRFVALKVKDALVDRIRDRRGSRPDVEKVDPDVPVRVIVRQGVAHLFRDLAGDSLHRRGYRPIQVKSPLSEAVAAGLLLLTGWDRKSPLLDPMCGSGTFVLEAASLALDRAPGLGREFAAERFPDADATVWARLREEAEDRVRRNAKLSLTGADRHSGAVGIARESARLGGFDRHVSFSVVEASVFEVRVPPAVVVTNPPWGDRLGEGDDLIASWRALGGLLRRCPGAAAFVLSGAPELTRHLGLKTSRRWPIRVGAKDLRWLLYEMRRRD